MRPSCASGASRDDYAKRLMRKAILGDAMPVSRRFTREELFALAEQAGFRIERWQAESMPYLVSALSGRGRIEWVLAFAATSRSA